MSWYRHANIDLLYFERLDLKGFFSDDNLLPFIELEYLPANFLIIFIIALQIRTNVSDDLSGFILLY